METILDKEKMDAMKVLADTTMKVSEAKASLAAIKASEGSYLAEREKKAVIAVEKILADSAELLKTAKENYECVHELCKTVSEAADYLATVRKELEAAVKEASNRDELWTIEAKKRQDNLDRLLSEVRTDKIRLTNDRESLQRERDALSRESRKIADGRAELERAIIRLKQGKI